MTKRTGNRNQQGENSAIGSPKKPLDFKERSLLARKAVEARWARRIAEVTESFVTAEKTMK